MVGQLLEIVKTAFENLPGIKTQDKNNTHTTKQTHTQTKNQHPHKGQATARQTTRKFVN